MLHTICGHGEGSIYELYCSQPPGGDPDVLISLLGSCRAVYVYIQSMLCAKQQT